MFLVTRDERIYAQAEKVEAFPDAHIHLGARGMIGLALGGYESRHAARSSCSTCRIEAVTHDIESRRAVGQLRSDTHLGTSFNASWICCSMRA
jgi:hypothetical protein